MRKIILGVAISLDGYIEGPKGEYDWCFTDQDYGLSDFMKQIDALMIGRKTYDMTKQMKGPNPWKGMTTYVVSNTLKTVNGKEMKLITGDLESGVMKVKDTPGKNVWLFGGAELTTSLMNCGLVDEFWLAVHPIVLGGGKPLFQNIQDRKKLKLLDTRHYDTGLVSLKYQMST